MWATRTISIPSFYYRTPNLEVEKAKIAVIEDGTRAPGMPTICSTLHCVDVRSGSGEFRANSTGRTLISRHNLGSFVEGEQPYLGGSIFFNSGLISSCRYELGGEGPIVRIHMRGLWQSQIARYTPEFGARLQELGHAIEGAPAPQPRRELAGLSVPNVSLMPRFSKDAILVVRASGPDGDYQGLARCTGSFPHVATFVWLGSDVPSAKTGSFSISPTTVGLEIISSLERVQPQADRKYVVHFYNSKLDRVVVGEALCRKPWGEGLFLMEWSPSATNQQLGLKGTFPIKEPPIEHWAEREVAG